jgi:hypothetical protein
MLQPEILILHRKTLRYPISLGNLLNLMSTIVIYRCFDHSYPTQVAAVLAGSQDNAHGLLNASRKATATTSEAVGCCKDAE